MIVMYGPSEIKNILKVNLNTNYVQTPTKVMYAPEHSVIKDYIVHMKGKILKDEKRRNV